MLGRLRNELLEMSFEFCVKPGLILILEQFAFKFGNVFTQILSGSIVVLTYKNLNSGLIFNLGLALT